MNNRNILINIFAVLLFMLSSMSLVRAEECSPLSVEVTTTPAPPSSPQSMKRSNQLITQVPEDSELVFMGDSLFALWDTQKQDLPGKKVWNFSVSGDQTQNLLWRLGKTDLDLVHPKAVVILIGTNNMSERGSEPCAVFAGIEAVIGKVQLAWPQAAVFVVGIPPRGAAFKAMDGMRKEINQMISSLGSKPGVHPVLLNEDELTCGHYSGPSLKENVLACMPDEANKCSNYRSDNLHLVQGGYKILVRDLQKVATFDDLPAFFGRAGAN